MEKQVEQALKEAGDLSGAFVWRRAVRDLEGSLRLLLVGRDEGLLERCLQSLGDLGRVHTSILTVETSEEDDQLGIQDRLFSCHAALWVTPITQPLSAEERDIIDAMGGLGAPVQRGVVLADTPLLERMSDDPAAERAEIGERVNALLPEDWPLLDQPADWVRAQAGQVLAITRARRKRIAALLVGDALREADDSVTHAGDEVAEVERLLALEDAELEVARKEGERVAAHMLGTMRRNTQQLLVDLRDFLRELEGSLPKEAEAVGNLTLLRRTLPHWLNHVVESWMHDRLTSWRATVLAELEEVRVKEGAHRAQLLPPALHPPPMAGDGSWAHRLATTAALGSGAVLVLLGMWIPGLLALSGALAWSAVTEEGTASASRDRLVKEGVEALRRMGREAETLLGNQLQQLEEELDALAVERMDAARGRQGDTRARLEEQRAFASNRLRELTHTRDLLATRAEALALPERSAAG